VVQFQTQLIAHQAQLQPFTVYILLVTQQVYLLLLRLMLVLALVAHGLKKLLQQLTAQLLTTLQK